MCLIKQLKVSHQTVKNAEEKAQTAAEQAKIRKAAE